MNLRLSENITAKMHFALPPRKSSHPPPYERASKSSPVRRKQLQLGAIIACVALVLIYLASSLLSSSPDRVPAGTPESVVVTVLDPETMSKEYIARIKANRIDYADRHGSLYSAPPPNNLRIRQILTRSCEQAMVLSSPLPLITTSMALHEPGPLYHPFVTLWQHSRIPNTSSLFHRMLSS